jgi:SAM-dependent methyltransferase
MMIEGIDFFDNDERFEKYRAGRYRSDRPNETLEKPVFKEMMGDVVHKRILDLGCGDGLFGCELIKLGAKSYVGLDSSIKMVQLANVNLRQTEAKVEHTKIESWNYPRDRFDLVVSRLALHYVEDLDNTFQNVNKTLKKHGRFVFSMVHPVITSSDKSRKKSGVRKDWIVDDYFTTGSRKVKFMDKFVKQYHRTIEDIFQSLQNANFVVEILRESRPKIDFFDDEQLYKRRMRIPLFIFFSVRKV